MLEALVDDTLIATGSAQLVIANDTTSHQLTARVQALQIGQRVYVYATAALNALLLLVVLMEAFRNSGWRSLPKFDFVDIKSVVIASSQGGAATAHEVNSLRTRCVQGGEVKYWCGDPTDRLAGTVKVGLFKSVRGPSLGPCGGSSVPEQENSRYQGSDELLCHCENGRDKPEP